MRYMLPFSCAQPHFSQRMRLFQESCKYGLCKDSAFLFGKKKENLKYLRKQGPTCENGANRSGGVAGRNGEDGARW